MLKASSTLATQPIVYFNFVYVYAGGARSTVQLVQALQCITNIQVVDVYGQAEDYLASLRALEIDPVILLPHWKGRTAIGGQTRNTRLLQAVGAIPGLARVILQLRHVLHRMQPRAIWVDNEKALFVTWLAAPPGLSIIYFVRGELERIAPYCIPAWHRVKAVVGVSDDSLRHIRTLLHGQIKFQVVYDGIDVLTTLQLAQREPPNLPAHDSQSLCIVMPAVISNPLKGHEIAIRAIAQFLAEGGQAHLWVCGDVPREVSRSFYNRLQALVAELDIRPNVHFLGWRSDMPAVMARADVVLLPSFTEGLPRSLLEAMALAKPVIATRVGGIPELVRESLDGLLINPGDVEGVVQALHRFSDPDVRARMGSTGQARIKENFSLPYHAQQFLSVVESIETSIDIKVENTDMIG